MGHGIRDESEDAKIVFVTTGYMVRLMAHHPHFFDKYTHLIIDEVHERSVDGDLLCLFARQLLRSNKTIRLILMSATIQVDIYHKYFHSDQEYFGDFKCLSVGARRFPVEIIFVDHLLNNKHNDMWESVDSIKKLCGNIMGDSIIPERLCKVQYQLVMYIIKQYAALGTAVLVFVSGIADITDLTEKFIGLNKYRVLAIHSEIPYEEQELVFEPASSNEVKVILATNAAESSVTLPDVDIVICLGTQKSITYNPQVQRVQLVNSFISQASATQRAGRTGRVRPGKVFRIYPSALYNSFAPHGISEILRIPLDDTILNLRVMLEDIKSFNGVLPILAELLEPPDVKNIMLSFEALHTGGMITSPDDSGVLTPCGKFAGQLPVDLQLGRMIAMGEQLGIREHAVMLAAALHLPKSPFRVASPFIHTDPVEFNNITRDNFESMLNLDGSLYSEPIMNCTILCLWIDMPLELRDKWLRKNNLVKSRMQHFHSSFRNLMDRVSKAVLSRNRNDHDVVVDSDAIKITIEERINLMRLVLAWSCDDNILLMKKLTPTEKLAATSIQLPKHISKSQIQNIFPIHYKVHIDSLRECVYHLPLTSRQVYMQENKSFLDIYVDVLLLAISSSSQSTSTQKTDKDIADMKASNNLELVWMISEGIDIKDSSKEKGSRDTNSDKYIVYTDDFILISITSTNDNLKQCILSLFDLNVKDVNFESLDFSSDFGYETFKIRNPVSNRVKSFLALMEDTFLVAVGIYFPKNGYLNLIAKNIDLNENLIFEAFPLIGNRSSEDEVRVQEKDKCVVVHFPSTPLLTSSLQNHADSKKNKVINDTTIIPIHQPLMKDIHPGLRLFSAYRLGHPSR